MATIIERQQVAFGTAAQWTALNPTLLAGEIGWESDTGKFKFGDGATAWNSLAYWGVSTYAPLASPAFTGTPTAPTQALGNNTTRLATTAFVAQGFAPAIASGSATLVAGTVAVTGQASTTANTRVRTTHTTVGGTPGALFISAKTAGTGFTIKSTSATDTSTVYWEVISF